MTKVRVIVCEYEKCVSSTNYESAYFSNVCVYLFLGTPLVRSPVLGHQDLDLYKLFKIVSKMKGMNKVLIIKSM